MKPLRKFVIHGRNVMWTPGPYTSWYVSSSEEYNTMVLKQHLAYHRARLTGAYGAEQLELFDMENSSEDRV